MTKWTLFWDMHSGGGTKEGKYENIYIEAPEKEARIIFYNRFGHSPDRVSCPCCGSDYSVNEYDSLEQASGFHRGCYYAYFDSKGNEVPESTAWKSGNGIIPGFSGGYIDRPDKKYAHKKFQTLKDYLKNDDVLVIRSSEIKPDERIA